ncbi:MAG: hypothetical protein E7388_02850 [Ruminococcaceae bacterium]|nr:hypothetical protein [Oscillospiraceae bacterium]
MKRIFFILFILIFILQPSNLVFANNRLHMIAEKTNKVPVMDGIITIEEWGKPIASFSGESEFVVSTLDKVDEERLPTETELYAIWDDDYLYFGAIVTSLNHQNNKRNAHIWQEDSLSLKIGLAENQAAEYRFVFALGAKNIPLGYLLCLPNETLDGTGLGIEVLLHYSDYYVARTEKETIYELRLPWDDYMVDDRIIEKGFQFYLTVELHTKGKYPDYPRRMLLGTYDDSRNWQYPIIELNEEIIIPSSTPIPTNTLSPSPTSYMQGKTTASPEDFDALDIQDEKNTVRTWMYLIVVAPIGILLTAILLMKKQKNIYK